MPENSHLPAAPVSAGRPAMHPEFVGPDEEVVRALLQGLLVEAQAGRDVEPVLLDRELDLAAERCRLRRSTLSTNRVDMRSNAAGLMFSPIAADSTSAAANTLMTPSSAGHATSAGGSSAGGSAGAGSAGGSAGAGSAGGSAGAGSAGGAAGGAASSSPPHPAAKIASVSAAARTRSHANLLRFARPPAG